MAEAPLLNNFPGPQSLKLLVQLRLTKSHNAKLQINTSGSPLKTVAHSSAVAGSSDFKMGSNSKATEGEREKGSSSTFVPGGKFLGTKPRRENNKF